MRTAVQEAGAEALYLSENAQKNLRRGIFVIPSLLTGSSDSLLSLALAFLIAQCFFGDLSLILRLCLVALVISCEVAILRSRFLSRLRSVQASLSIGLILSVEVAFGWAWRKFTLQALVTDGIPDRVSFVIPARYELDYIVQTVAFIYENTPIQLIQEVIVIDDLSDVPVEQLVMQSMSRSGLLGFLSAGQRRTLLVVRNEKREGLIRSKIKGADMSSGTHILFLDGHCRVMPGYLQSMLARIKGNYRRIVVPMIPDTDNKTWRIRAATGIKMMFAWDFSFDWFDYPGDEVPILSGGILLMTKRWWVESGGYDSGMLEWGGENLDQSMRVWQCGGEIVVERSAIIGHIFYRTLPADKTTGLQVIRNQARAAVFWLDDYYELFLTAVPAVRNIGLGSGVAEQFGRRAAMQCHGFDWFVDRFRSVFELRGLVLNEMHHLRHVESSLCLDVSGGSPRGGPPASLHLRVCAATTLSQRWGLFANGTRLVNAQVHRCLQWSGINHRNWWTQLPRLEDCDYTLQDIGQMWAYSGTYPNVSTQTSGDITSSWNATVQLDGFVMTGPASNARESGFDKLRGYQTQASPLCLTSSKDNQSISQVIPCAGLHGCIYLSPCHPGQILNQFHAQVWEWIW